MAYADEQSYEEMISALQTYQCPSSALSIV